MKKIIKNFGLLVLLGILITSCNEDENTGASMTHHSSDMVTLSAITTNIDESAIDPDDSSTYTVTITASIPEAKSQDAVIDIWQSAGNADTNDYHLSSDFITIPAGSTSASESIEFMQTGDVEGEETLTINASARAGFSLSPFTHTVSIFNDYINDVLDLSLSWDGEFTNGDVTIESLCDIDYDLILADGSGNLLGYIAGTTACPENGSLSGLDDGTYYLIADLYDNPFSGLGFTDVIPLALEYSQEYFATSGVINNANHTISTVGATNLSVLTGLAIVEVSGYNYTVTGL